MRLRIQTPVDTMETLSSSRNVIIIFRQWELKHQDEYHFLKERSLGGGFEINPYLDLKWRSCIRKD